MPLVASEAASVRSVGLPPFSAALRIASKMRSPHPLPDCNESDVMFDLPRAALPLRIHKIYGYIFTIKLFYRLYCMLNKKSKEIFIFYP